MPGTVVLTASAGRFPGLVEQLRELSIDVEERPLMDFALPQDWRLLDTALDRALGCGYAAIVFTSPRAAAVVVERLRGRGLDWSASEWRGPEIWVAGAGTARALGDLVGDLHTPDENDVGRRGAAAALVHALLESGINGPVLFPCGDHRRDELPARLRDDGVEVDEVVCYRSVLASEHEAREAAERAAVLVVASPRVAELLARACPLEKRPALLAIGPITAAASRASGWPAAAVAKHPTAEAVGAAARSLLE